MIASVSAQIVAIGMHQQHIARIRTTSLMPRRMPSSSGDAGRCRYHLARGPTRRCAY